MLSYAEEQYPGSDSPLCTPTPNAEPGVKTPVQDGRGFFISLYIATLLAV